MFRPSCLAVKARSLRGRSLRARPNNCQAIDHLQPGIDAVASVLLKRRFGGLKSVELAQHLPVAGGLMRLVRNSHWLPDCRLNCCNHDCPLRMRVEGERPGERLPCSCTGLNDARFSDLRIDDSGKCRSFSVVGSGQVNRAGGIRREALRGDKSPERFCGFQENPERANFRADVLHFLTRPHSVSRGP